MQRRSFFKRVMTTIAAVRLGRFCAAGIEPSPAKKLAVRNNAERYLIASGNVDNAAIWDRGTLPNVGDDCYANGFTGTFTASRTAASWRTTAGNVAASGGGWACSTAGVKIVGNLIAGTTTCLTISNVTGTVKLEGKVIIPEIADVYGVYKTGTGHLELTNPVFVGKAV